MTLRNNYLEALKVRLESAIRDRVKSEISGLIEDIITEETAKFTIDLSEYTQVDELRNILVVGITKRDITVKEN